MFNFDHPFFAVPWRRQAIVTFCLCWGVFEFFSGAPFWGVIFVGLGAIAWWQFRFIDWSKYDKEDDG